MYFRVYHFNSIYSYQFISSLLAVHNYHHYIVFSIRHPIICFKKEINNTNSIMWSQTLPWIFLFIFGNNQRKGHISMVNCKDSWQNPRKVLHPFQNKLQRVFMFGDFNNFLTKDVWHSLVSKLPSVSLVQGFQASDTK